MPATVRRSRSVLNASCVISHENAEAAGVAVGSMVRVASLAASGVMGSRDGMV